MIRKAELYDVPKINELGLLVNKKFPKLFKMNEIINEKISRVLVYEQDDRVIGFLHVTELHEVADIINIVIDPKHRKQGIASCLFDYLMGELPKEICLITLEVDADNEAGIKLYQKFGFEIINKRKGYYDNEKDAYLMGRKL